MCGVSTCSKKGVAAFIRRRPEGLYFWLFSCASAFSTASTICLTLSRYIVPSLVTSNLRVVRFNKVVSSLASSRDTDRLTAETVIDNSSAAELIEPVSTTAIKVRISSRVAFIVEYISN
ncbi:hypothetical protein AT1219_110009 [Vibrio alginolyticus]